MHNYKVGDKVIIVSENTPNTNGHGLHIGTVVTIINFGNSDRLSFLIEIRNKQQAIQWVAPHEIAPLTSFSKELYL